LNAPTTIVADTSIFLAILLKEDDAEKYNKALLETSKILISSATAVEIYIVVSHRLGAEGIIRLI
jgi:ribonuclease VapC